MNEVEKARLSKGHTFKTQNMLLLRTKEEANLRGISIKVEKVDVQRFICWSRDEPKFVVIAYLSLEKGYEVKHALVCDMDTDDTWNGIIPGGKLFVANFNNFLLIPHCYHVLCFSHGCIKQKGGQEEATWEVHPIQGKGPCTSCPCSSVEESLVIEQGYGIAAHAVWKYGSNCVCFYGQFASKHKEAGATGCVWFSGDKCNICDGTEGGVREARSLCARGGMGH